MIDPDIRSILEQQLMLEPSESELITIASMVKKLMLRKSSWKIIPRWRFETEGKIHIVTQYDDVEPKSVQEALTCQAKDE